MGDSHTVPGAPLRLAELVAAFSLATDIGTGVPVETMLSVALMAVHLGEAHGLSDAELVTTYYLPLLALTGCTATAPLSTEMLGDETDPDVVGEWLNTDFGKPREAMGFIFRNIGKDKPPLNRVAFIFSLLSGGLVASGKAHCEVARRVSERLGFGQDIQDSIWHVNERWDGRGAPNKVKGEALTLPARILHVSLDIVYAYQSGGHDAAVAMAKHKIGTKYDPALVETFLRNASRLLPLLDAESIWDATLKAEPGPHPVITEDRLDTAAKAIADFADLKTPFMVGHSTHVAELASAAAKRYGLPASDIVAVQRAALVHDVGRVGITARIWGKSNALTESEWERVRLYPYYTERVLARPRALAPLGTLAALHRERLDGSGYHKGFPATLLTPSARILAAADAYQAMTEPRPYRPALDPGAAAEQLRKEVRSGHIDSEAANAVLAVAGHQVGISRLERLAGLSDREMEVLRLLARGLPVKDIAETLVVSKKTLDNHVQHIYNKIGVSTRAAATFFAMEHNLV
jgi:HD-GYP domain-containing protein (c-di-GMP phosphodiesterase class II)